MRDIAVVASAMHQESVLPVAEVQMMTGLLNAVREQSGFAQEDIGFVCSGSSDFLAGGAFSFVMTLDAVGPVPPVNESHVEMDGAWALYEAWVKLQIGEIDTALVYSYGKSSPGSLRDILSTQLDPYYVAPLWPDAFSIAALQARAMLDAGTITEERMAEIAVRSQANAKANPLAVRSGDTDVASLLDEPMIASPLRRSDCAAGSDGGVAVILAAGDAAKVATDRPAWIRGIDHRIDPHHFGVRDMHGVPSAAKAADKAGVANDKVDFAELHAAFTTHEHLLESALGLGDGVDINPSGGALAGHTMMASGLMRIAEAAQRISAGAGDRAVAHASSGPLLQQNLVAVLEGE